MGAGPKRPWPAVTPVTIINRRERPVLLERFSLPTPLLSVYRNGQGLLWTPGITVECETDMNSASLRIDQSAPQAAGECELLAPAREKLAKGRRLVRAFDHDRPLYTYDAADERSRGDLGGRPNPNNHQSNA